MEHSTAQRTVVTGWAEPERAAASKKQGLGISSRSKGRGFPVTTGQVGSSWMRRVVELERLGRVESCLANTGVGGGAAVNKMMRK